MPQGIFFSCPILDPWEMFEKEMGEMEVQKWK